MHKLASVIHERPIKTYGLMENKYILFAIKYGLNTTQTRSNVLFLSANFDTHLKEMQWITH